MRDDRQSGNRIELKVNRERGAAHARRADRFAAICSGLTDAVTEPSAFTVARESNL